MSYLLLLADLNYSQGKYNGHVTINYTCAFRQYFQRHYIYRGAASFSYSTDSLLYVLCREIDSLSNTE